MTRDSLAFAVSGTVFGLLVGWIIGTQQVQVVPPPAQVADTPAASAPAPSPGQPQAFDASRAAELETRAKAEPRNAQVRADLGNVYYDARRFEEAIPWYEASLAIEPNDVNVSTDLAVAYYGTKQVDRAVQQADRSLAIDARHLKTLLNKGIFLAFGKEDMAGAAKVWERVVEIAPDTEEGRLAKQGLQGLATAHQDAGRGTGNTP